MVLERQSCETAREKRCREKGNFQRVESQLSVLSVAPIHFPKTFLISWAEYLASFLGWRFNHPAAHAEPRHHDVWLFDNTAFQHSTLERRDSPHTWKAEVVAAIFEKHGRQDLGRMIALVVDLIGLDGNVGDDPAVRERIAKRLQPFVNEVAPARLILLDVQLSPDNVQKYKLGPSDGHGIISHAIRVEGSEPIQDGTAITPSLRNWPEPVMMNTKFAAPEGWLVVSDIDDTIKYTMTPDAIGILQTTFAEEPKVIDGMPELYVHIHKRLMPTWFYLSASPYNLYPFLRSFLHEHYPPGTMILRNNSWQSLAGLLKSFTQGTQAYKVDRMLKVQSWFPKRKVLCIGDSTQGDPEAYAEMYAKHGKWIKAIYIRKVNGLPNMEEKNSTERFEETFKNVPRDVWKIFETTEELYGLVDQLPRLHPEK